LIDLNEGWGSVDYAFFRSFERQGAQALSPLNDHRDLRSGTGRLASVTYRPTFAPADIAILVPNGRP
jgi:hypothetical protein